METKSEIIFAEKKLKDSFVNLEKGKFEEKELFKWLSRAINDLSNNAFCGIQIPKTLIPKEYLRYNITNLWKCDLPKGWRLIYSVKSGEISILSWCWNVRLALT